MIHHMVFSRGVLNCLAATSTAAHMVSMKNGIEAAMTMRISFKLNGYPFSLS